MSKLSDYSDQAFKQSIELYKSKLPAWAQTSGNFAYAKANIEGVSKTDYFAHSAINTEIPSVQGSGISIQPENDVFNALNVNSSSSGMVLLSIIYGIISCFAFLLKA